MTDRPSTPGLLGDRYELIRRIARGGMAEVYEGLDTVLQRRVAIKVLFDKHADDPAFLARFKREAQSAGRLTHPNIVGVYDWGGHDGTQYIVMEYVEGQNLAERLADGRLLPEAAVAVAVDVAGALSAAHQQGTVHRDIKPGNIMLAADGRAKVADFGIARAVEGDADLTETGKVVGTAAYFSPEQAQGLAVDTRSDLYALGVVLFEMLTGQPPFAGPGPGAMALQHVEEMPPLASQRVDTVPSDLDTIIDRLLAKRPDDRYPSAGALLDDLQRFVRGESLAAEKAIAASAAGAAISAHATAVLGATPGDLAPTAILHGHGHGHGPGHGHVAGPAPAPAPPAAHGVADPVEPPRIPTRGGLLVATMAVALLAVIGLVFVLANRNDDAGGVDETTSSTVSLQLPAPAATDGGPAVPDDGEGQEPSTTAPTDTSAPPSTDGSTTAPPPDGSTTAPTATAPTPASSATAPTTAATTATTTATTAPPEADGG
ncbi:MAG: protein kinase [Acidimicrobiales bacterium]